MECISVAILLRYVITSLLYAGKPTNPQGRHVATGRSVTWRWPWSEARMSAERTDPTTSAPFAARLSVEQVEEGLCLAPRFDADGLIPCITTDAATSEVLMLGYMNGEALQRTIATGEAHYWSRSRQCLWRKGATSGLVQEVVELRIDDDQDAVWIRVTVAGSGASDRERHERGQHRRGARRARRGGTLADRREAGRDVERLHLLHAAGRPARGGLDSPRKDASTTCSSSPPGSRSRSRSRRPSPSRTRTASV